MGIEDSKGATEVQMTDEALFWEAAVAIEAAKTMPVGTDSMDLNINAVGDVLDTRIYEIERRGFPFYKGTSDEWKPVTPELKEVHDALWGLQLELDTAHATITGRRRDCFSVGVKAAVRGSGVFRGELTY